MEQIEEINNEEPKKTKKGKTITRNSDNKQIDDSQMIENPFNKPIKDLYKQLKSLPFKGLRIITSMIAGFVFVLVLIIMVPLWLYGFFPVMATTFWRFISSATKEMEKLKIMEKMPYAVEIGAFFIVWVPFAIACVPFMLVSLIGHLINLCANQFEIEKHDSNQENM